MLTLTIKTCQIQIEKEKNIWKTITLKKNALLYHLINYAEELENINVNK